MRSLPTGSYVFADLDRLSVKDAERAAVVWNTLANANDGIRLFNHPIRSMRRFELLRHLYEKNINTFNVNWLTDPAAVRRFPVFIRSEDDHRGPLTPLLHSVEELNDAIENLVTQGKSKVNKIIVEYLDYKDEAGLYHKHSSIVVDSEILFTSVSRRNHWMVKAVPPYLGNESSDQEYKHQESKLKDIFELANIDYGRIDYTIAGGRLQVFEINTNPTIWPPELLLKIARTIDSSPTRRKVLVTATYQPPWRELKSTWYWVGRLIHSALRTLNLMQYERSVIRTLRELKRRVFR